MSDADEKLRMDVHNNMRITRIEDGFLDLKLEIDELKRFQEITHLQYQHKKTYPHKCPVCDARGFVFTMYSITDSKQEKCTPCDGKGIVWG